MPVCPGGVQALQASVESRTLISCVPQGSILLSGTIAENLRPAKPDASDAETERKVLENILRPPCHTCILPTHRPSVLSMCVRVYRTVDRRITRLDSREIDSIARSF